MNPMHGVRAQKANSLRSFAQTPTLSDPGLLVLSTYKGNPPSQGARCDLHLSESRFWTSANYQTTEKDRLGRPTSL